MRHTVTLHSSDGTQIGSLRVGVNRHGQLPAVIVDPPDAKGRVMHGLWLGDVHDRRLDGTPYHHLTAELAAREPTPRIGLTDR